MGGRHKRPRVRVSVAFEIEFTQEEVLALLSAVSGLVWAMVNLLRLVIG